MKLPALSQVLTNDPGPFATAYADVSRVAAAGDDAGRPHRPRRPRRARRRRLPRRRSPTPLQDALGASTHGAARSPASSSPASGACCSPPSSAAGARSRRTSWGAAARPRPVARRRHAGRARSCWPASTTPAAACRPTRRRARARCGSEQEAGGDANFLHKTGADSHEGSVEEEWKRSADDVAAEIERQVTAGPSLVLVGGEPDAVSEVRAKLTHLEAEVVELAGGRRNADGGEDGLRRGDHRGAARPRGRRNLDVLAS